MNIIDRSQVVYGPDIIGRKDARIIITERERCSDVRSKTNKKVTSCTSVFKDQVKKLNVKYVFKKQKKNEI